MARWPWRHRVCAWTRIESDRWEKEKKGPMHAEAIIQKELTLITIYHSLSPRCSVCSLASLCVHFHMDHNPVAVVVLEGSATEHKWADIRSTVWCPAVSKRSLACSTIPHPPPPPTPCPDPLCSFLCPMNGFSLTATVVLVLKPKRSTSLADGRGGLVEA